MPNPMTKRLAPIWICCCHSTRATSSAKGRITTNIASRWPIGYLDLTTSRPNPIVPPGFREGLAAAGFVEGRNVTIEARFARNQGERLAQFAAELVERKVAVIVALDLGSPGLCGEGCHLDNSNCFQAFQRSD